MGNGIGTAAANRVAAYLGGVARRGVGGSNRRVRSARPRDLVRPLHDRQENQDTEARNPRWVPAISSATSASIGAHVGTHAAAEAARVIFRFGLWPAALELWGLAPTDLKALEWEKAGWKDGHLVMSGLALLPLAAVAAKAHAQNGVVAAMAHGFNRWSWSHAIFGVAGEPWTADIDALAVRRAGGEFVCLDRSYASFRRPISTGSGTATASLCGTAVRVTIERTTGRFANRQSL